MTILDSDRYLALLSDLTAAANDPPLGGPAAEPEATAPLILPRLLARPARRLRRGVRGLGDDPADESLHEVRKRAKDLRYAAEAAVPVLGTPARKLAAAAQELQGVLGGPHNAVVAEAWLRRSGTSGAPSQALVAGQLIERETPAAGRMSRGLARGVAEDGHKAPPSMDRG